MGIHLIGSGIQTVGAFNRYRLVRAGAQTQAPVALEGIRRDALQLMSTVSVPVAKPAEAPVAKPVERPVPRPIPRPADKPTPAPVPTPAPAPAVQVKAAAPKLDLPGIKRGLQLMLARGTKIMGYSIDGTARVDKFDGQSIALTVNASAAFGLVRKLIGLKAEAKPDGTMSITAQELNQQGQPVQTYFDDNLKVVSNKPGEVILQGPDGRPGALKIGSDGRVILEHPAAGQIVLTVA